MTEKTKYYLREMLGSLSYDYLEDVENGFTGTFAGWLRRHKEMIGSIVYEDMIAAFSEGTVNGIPEE